jgi:hypothetical protein
MPDSAKSGFTINSTAYDFLKWIALVVLPALAALILTLGIVLNWGDAQVVAGVVTAVDTFLGAILGKSASNYQAQQNMGDLVVSQDHDGTIAGMRIVGNHENQIFTEGEVVNLTVKREQAAAPPV